MLVFLRCFLSIVCFMNWSCSAFGGGLAGGSLMDGAGVYDSTYLIELKQGSDFSGKVQNLQDGGYETAYGKAISFNRWYSTRWTDVSVAWMTQFTKNFGVIFGGSTGERGEKYRIAPSFKLGFVAQTAIGRNASLSFRVTSVLGGQLKEKTCIADYGEVGGVQTVNCRLAASILEPSETLKYLLNERPINRNLAFVQFNWQF